MRLESVVLLRGDPNRNKARFRTVSLPYREVRSCIPIPIDVEL